MIDTYTRLLEATAELADAAHADAAIAKLIRHLKSAGRMKMLPQIARELKKVAARRRAEQPIVEVASEEECAAALRAAATEGFRAHRAVVNPTLIRGWRARAEGKLADRSAKRALIDIYQRVTS
jgi:F0F1-type ATP synthase delta subunit